MRKSLSPQGTGQVEVKENPPSPRLRRWQPKKLGDRFFVGKFWIYPPHPGLPATNWNFLTFCLQGLPKKHTFISPLLFGCVGGGGRSNVWTSSLTSMVDVMLGKSDFLLATRHPPFSFFLGGSRVGSMALAVESKSLFEWNQRSKMPILASS